MTKTTKAMLRIGPIGIVASAIVFAGCVAPAGAINAKNLSDPARPNVATQRTFSGVAKNNMSDAARGTNLNSFVGVAKNNMSDAARDASLVVVRRALPGVAANNMSDAARQANIAAAQSFQGVAASNMSDAARKAVYGPRLRRHH
jgi:hypothetical protein